MSGRRGNFLGRASVQDPFAVLGLKQGASSEQIKRAYHSLSLRYHPDKDKTVPIHLSTARFQRIKAAYDLLSDLPRRKALAKTVISAPFRPNVVGEVRRKQKASPKAKEKKAKKAKAKEAKPTRVSQSVNSSSQEALVILDSEEEGAEVSIVSISGKAKRKKQDEETARFNRLRAQRASLRAAAKVRAKARAHLAKDVKACSPKAGSEGKAESPSGSATSFVRLVFREGGISGERSRPVVSSAEVEGAFKRFGVRVMSMHGVEVILATASAKKAIACALSFHGWSARSPKDPELRVLKQMSLAVAPVDCTGRASAGPKTLVVSRTMVAASDGTTSKIV